MIRPYVGNRVLEIGAGIGNMTMHLLPRAATGPPTSIPRISIRSKGSQINRPYLHVAMRRWNGRAIHFPLANHLTP